MGFPSQQNKVWPPGTTDPGTGSAEALLKVGDTYFNTSTGVYRKCTNATFPATWADISVVPATNFQLVGGLDVSETVLNTERVIGGFVLNGATYPNITFRFVGRFDPGTAGNFRVRLYDIGPAAGPAIAPVLRSTLSIPFASAGNIVRVEQALTATPTPGTNVNQISNTARIYELRDILDGVGVSDLGIVHWAGIEVS